jgi:hypothetical protein
MKLACYKTSDPESNDFYLQLLPDEIERLGLPDAPKAWIVSFSDTGVVLIPRHTTSQRGDARFQRKEGEHFLYRVRIPLDKMERMPMRLFNPQLVDINGVRGLKIEFDQALPLEQVLPKPQPPNRTFQDLRAACRHAREIATELGVKLAIDSDGEFIVKLS